jgi:hypothetical protein
MASGTKLEAYRWWNAQLPFTTNLDTTPELVEPEIAHSVWSKICPIFLLFVLDERDAGSYWNAIFAIVSMFDLTKNVPHPIGRFPDFVVRLFLLRRVMIPQTVNESIRFIDRFGFRDSAHFFLYQSPVFLLDPILYLDTIMALRDRNHSLWSSFVGSPKLVNAFLQLYGSFMAPLPPNASDRSWRHRILITEVLYGIIQDVFHVHPEILSFCSIFLDLSMSLLESAGFNVGILLLRPILSVISSLVKTMPQEQLSSYVMRLLEVLDRSESPHFYLACRFFISIKPIQINRAEIIGLVSNRAIRDIGDLEIILALADSGPWASKLLSILTKMAISNKLWHRACFGVVGDLVVRYGHRNHIREWFCTIIRRLFIFVALAHQRRRYRVRSLLICESINSFCQRPGWMAQTITAAVSAIASRPLPPYFGSLFENSPLLCDDLMVHEYDMFYNSISCLKTFPFDSTPGICVLVPLKEMPAPMIRVQKSGSSRGIRISTNDLKENEDGSKADETKKRGLRSRKRVTPAIIRRPSRPRPGTSPTDIRRSIMRSSSYA